MDERGKKGKLWKDGGLLEGAGAKGRDIRGKMKRTTCGRRGEWEG